MGIGVSQQHIRGILQVARENNFFLFVRPTEDDSLRLIDEGYATKSMDIHDKSSNWGPMAGFVPCDGAFSKAPTGNPRKDLHVHRHGLAVPVQLQLTEGVLRQLVNGKITRDENARIIVSHANTNFSIGARLSATFHPSAASDPFGSGLSFSALPYHVYRPTQQPAAIHTTIYFAIDPSNNRVWWFETGANAPVRPDQKYPVTLEPLMVWAYNVQGGLKPVTGDYDIWALVPHVSTLSDLGEHVLVKIDRGAHGASAASAYFKRISDALNLACHRSGNTVFNHGAEAQNFGFTQKHDAEILMFPPVDDVAQVRKVSIADMAHVLSAIQRAGYLVLLNRQWTVRRPKLMGKELPEYFRWLMSQDHAQLNAARKASGTFRPAAGKLPLPRGANPHVPVMWRKLAGAVLAHSRMEASSKLDAERQKMVDWYNTLKQLMPELDGGSKVLTRKDFPPAYRMADEKSHQLQMKIEQLAAQEMTGEGANDTETLRQTISQLGKELSVFWTGGVAAENQSAVSS